MSTLTTINSSDLITNSRAVINDNFSALNTDKIETSYLDTDTTLAANSDTKIATQKAVKAYVDTGGNANASTTTKGIVEEATQAELDAGTGTGATGARLFVNPSLSFGTSATVTAGETITGATLPVPVYQNKTDNEFYMCDANDATKYKFLGFATSNGTDGGSMSVKFGGIVSGFTGLDEGEKYYVSDTVGTIANAPGTQEIMVGVAISTTQLLIQKGRRVASGVATFNSTTTSAITLGFRPSKVSVHSTSGTTGSSYWASSMGGWDSKGGNYCVYNSGFDDGSSINSGSTTSAWLSRDGNGSNGTAGNITTITDTGFTLDSVETGTSQDCFIYWQAEGEL